MHALERDDAFVRLAGDDPRPLLVMRECGLCKGTDDAVLSRNLDNEKPLLLSRWFHCVKLKQSVLEDEHTFNKLFAGRPKPHLFLSSADGQTYRPLPGDQTPSVLVNTMSDVLFDSYEGNPKRALKELFKVLTRYDHLDSMEDGLREQKDMEIERRGPNTSKMKRLQAKLDRIAAQKAAAKAREKEITDSLVLRARTTGTR